VQSSEIECKTVKLKEIDSSDKIEQGQTKLRTKMRQRLELFTYSLAFLQAVTGCFIAENPFRSVAGRHLGFLRRALPGTSGRGQKSRERGGGGKGKTLFLPGFFAPLPAPLPSLALSTLNPAQS